jgi:hypothetical protein
MNRYLRKLFVRFETIAHPASGWLRSGAEAPQKGKSKKSNSTIIRPISPDSFNVRGRSDKKNDNIRRTPAP